MLITPAARFTYDGTSVDNTGLLFRAIHLSRKPYLEGVRKALELAPQGSTGTLTPARTWRITNGHQQPQRINTIGRHLTQLNLALSIQQVKNAIYFTGGEVAGNNLLKVYKDDASIAKYGQKALRISNNRVTDASIAKQSAPRRCRQTGQNST